MILKLVMYFLENLGLVMAVACIGQTRYISTSSIEFQLISAFYILIPFAILLTKVFILFELILLV